MPEAFLKLSASDRREALAVAAAASGRPLHLLDKDVWLVWILDVLFRCSLPSSQNTRTPLKMRCAKRARQEVPVERGVSEQGFGQGRNHGQTLPNVFN